VFSKVYDYRMDKMRKPICLLLIVLIIVAVGPVTATAKNPVLISGSTTVLPLAEAGAEAFNGEQSNYTVLVTGGGTYAGIENIAKGKSDIAMASSKVAELDIISSGYKFKERLIGHDGIVIVVSKQIYDAGVTTLTKDQVKRIYSGEINNWKDIGGLDERITVLARENGSGTRDVFNEDIMGRKTAAMPGSCIVADSNEKMKLLIKESSTAIGYLGFSYSEDGSVGVITLDGVKPTAETIKNSSYELARDLYFYTYGGSKPGAQAFIDFMVGPAGQKIAEELGFVPL
jgi:phosphate transport system substrate-binding protein